MIRLLAILILFTGCNGDFVSPMGPVEIPLYELHRANTAIFVARVQLDADEDSDEGDRECTNCFGTGKVHQDGRPTNQKCGVCNGTGVATSSSSAPPCPNPLCKCDPCTCDPCNCGTTPVEDRSPQQKASSAGSNIPKGGDESAVTPKDLERFRIEILGEVKEAFSDCCRPVEQPSEEQEEAKTEEPKPVLILSTGRGDWCPPCVQIKESGILDQLREDYELKVNYVTQQHAKAMSRKVPVWIFDGNRYEGFAGGSEPLLDWLQSQKGEE